MEADSPACCKATPVESSFAGSPLRGDPFAWSSWSTSAGPSGARRASSLSSTRSRRRATVTSVSKELVSTASRTASRTASKKASRRPWIARTCALRLTMLGVFRMRCARRSRRRARRSRRRIAVRVILESDFGLLTWPQLGHTAMPQLSLWEGVCGRGTDVLCGNGGCGSVRTVGWSLKYTAVRPHSDATVDFVGMGDVGVYVRWAGV